MSRSFPPQSAPRFTRPPDDTYSSGEDIDYPRHQLVHNVLTNHLIKRITGRGEEAATLYGSRPKNQYFAGALVNQYEYTKAQEEDDSFQNFAEDIAPFTIGLRFRVPTTISDEEEIQISPSAIGFQRRLPSLDEQRNHSIENEDAEVLFEEADTTEQYDQQEIDENEREEEDYDRLLPVFERIPFEFSSHTITGAELKELVAQKSLKEISLDLADAYQRAAEVEHRYRELEHDVSEAETNQVPISVLADEEKFNDYLDNLFTDEVLDPLWNARLEVNARKDSQADTNQEFISITVRLVNTHGENFEAATDPDYEDWRTHLFDVGIDIDVSDSKLGSFKSKEIEDEYQYDGDIFAVGENCAVEPIYPDSNDEGEPDPVGVRTETVPTYKQARYLSRTPDDIVAQMSVLAGEKGRESVFEALERIAEAMRDAEQDYRAIKEEMTETKTNDAKDDFEDAVESFVAERERFESGIECLRTDRRAYQAFTLSNRAFQEHGIPQWYMFQIVFFVMCVPDMVKQAAAVDDNSEFDFDSQGLSHGLDLAETIYFPTGGGKTEAYLALVIFTAFLDRIRGKEFGTTAFTKFPLRFLSLQQLQRAANVFAEAELLRRSNNLGGEEFSLGYLVGKQNTPNKLMEDGGQNRIREAEQDEEAQENWLYVDECPFCHEETVEITGDRERGRIIHKCTNDRCDEDELPIYISDIEVYRYAPTFVVSTIDKISIIGMQRRMRTIFGQAKLRCSKHGLSGESECIVQEKPLRAGGECSKDDWVEVDSVEPPSLLIQDELHLLREEFGAFDSHYETFIQAYNDRLTDGKWDMKVVTATATIEGADRQVRALYQKEANIFPGKGPRLRQSFYAFEHPLKTQRTMVGAIPRSIGRTYAIEKIHEEYARIIHEYQDNPDDMFDRIQTIDDQYAVTDAAFPDDPEERRNAILEVLEDYEVQVSYHYSKDNTDLMMRVLRTMINEHLKEDDDLYKEINGKLLTGETDLGEVREILRRILNHEEEDIEPIHMLVATAMISHGVDIDRLNFIGFFGLPRQTAEYIQSYSRVGREWPATVFLLHNPIRIRDRTYYTQFQKYQAYQDLLVEATPLERWAEFAIQCTLPGIFCAALLQYYDYELEGEPGMSDRVYMFDGFNEAAGDRIDPDELFEFVSDAYGINEAEMVSSESSTSSGVELYKEQLRDEFDKLWDACINPDNRVADAIANDPNTDENNFIPTGVLSRAESVRTPMSHLRDIDEQVTIEPDVPTTRVARGYRK